MLDKLLELIVRCADWFIPFCFIRAYQRGIILRFGKKNRRLLPGFHWLWPCGIEEPATANVSLDAVELPPQSLETRDGVAVLVQISIGLHIVNEELYLIDIEGVSALLPKYGQGIVSRFIQARTFDEVREHQLLSDIKRAMAAMVAPWGLAVDEIIMENLTRCKTVRLVGDLPKSGAGPVST